MIINPYRYAASSTLLDGLVSWWSLDEASGTRADSHGSNDLTDVNTVGSAAGQIGNAASITSTSSESLDGDPAWFDWTQPWTGVFWVDTTGISYNYTPIAFMWSTAGALGVGYSCFYDNTIDRFTWRVRDGGTTDKTVNSAAGLAHGWRFVVITYEPSVEIGISVDAGALSTTALTGQHSYASGLVFRHGGAGNGPSFLLDEVGHWDRLLTTDEITELYNGGAGIGYPG